ncbi:o-succinylbenzoate synthase [Microlunatus soli]|uniref:o-succinylbenzoate synthase n=1 Tax=Microlunatus soli TaxID=630515 RepID=A0A1H1RH13_9ACTN|nr:o-succinylbenzoate synthase [Microlunatus soli]SDS34998.1 O-succinylbenzoate synthase [Microlunatus soli]
MKIDELLLHTVSMPLVAPFTTSFGTQTERIAVILELRARDDHGDPVTGWGECVAMAEPLYSSEYAAGARRVIGDFLLPILAAAEHLTAETVDHLLKPIVGHRMAKAAVEMAVLDAQLRSRDLRFADYLGAVRDSVPSGVSIGIQPSIDQLLDTVQGYLDQGYVRIKLKIEPGRDIAPVRAVRERFGDDLLLQVDANAAYTLVDAPLLRRLDDFNLLLIEQPLGEEDLRQHAELARQMRTPMCLDESIVSAEAAADAITLGAAAVINIKPGRVGGYLEARKIHDLARAHGIAVWCGGMIETGIGRAANAALAALPGFTLPGDISASDRFYRTDITEPITIDNGSVTVPTGPGLCSEPIRDALAEFTVDSTRIPIDR